MGVVIFLLICCVVVLLGLCIKWNSEKYSENTTEAKELSVDTGEIVLNSYKPFPNITPITSNKTTKQKIQSILKLLLQVQTNPTNYIYMILIYTEKIFVFGYGTHYLIQDIPFQRTFQ